MIYNHIMERFKMIASVYLLLVKRKRILLLRRINTGYEDGKYGLPAGHVEDNETIRAALRRETKEEIGILLKLEDLKLVHVMHRKEKDIRVDFFFTIKEWKQEPKNNEPNKCDDLRWFPINNLPKNTIPYIRKAIENWQSETFYSEIGWK